MKKVLCYFFVAHLLVLFTNALSCFIEQMNPHIKKIPVLGSLKRLYFTPLFRPYMILSGIESGYGFYGRNVATHKYYFIEFYDKDNRLLETFDYANLFKTTNGFSRFQTFPSKLYNFIIKTEDQKKESLNEQGKKLVKLRESYTEKTLKYIARAAVKKVQTTGIANGKITSCKIKFITVVPPLNLFSNDNFTSNKQNIYLLKEIRLGLKDTVNTPNEQKSNTFSLFCPQGDN